MWVGSSLPNWNQLSLLNRCLYVACPFSQETQKLAKEVASNVEATNQKLAPKIKSAYDDFIKQTEELQKKLHEAANKQ